MSKRKSKKAKAVTATPPPNRPIRKQADEILRQYGLSERERLQYVRFMQDVTDAIIRNNLTTETAIEKLYEIHIDRNRDTLDERRLRGLLEALKEDLGVQTSRKADTYASVHRATTFDNEPLPPAATKRDSVILTPKTPYNDDRRPSYDIDTPLPWQSDDDIIKPPTIAQRPTHEFKRDSLTTNKLNPLNDDFLFSPPSTTTNTTTSTIKPKPRLSLQTRVEEPPHINDIPDPTPTESEDHGGMNFNATVRKPMTDLHNMDWLTETPSFPTTKKNNHFEEEEDEDRSPSPPQHDNPSGFDPYGSNEFEEHDHESDRSEQ